MLDSKYKFILTMDDGEDKRLYYGQSFYRKYNVSGLIIVLY